MEINAKLRALIVAMATALLLVALETALARR
jgi:hypothetical protein